MTPEMEYAIAAQKWAAEVLEWAVRPRPNDDSGDHGSAPPPPKL